MVTPTDMPTACANTSWESTAELTTIKKIAAHGFKSILFKAGPRGQKKLRSK